MLLYRPDYEESDYVFTKPEGGPYHPQLPCPSRSLSWTSRLTWVSST